MANPRPTGNGEERGIYDAQRPGTPAPSRPERARANNARYGNDGVHTRPNDSSADGSIDLERSAHV